MSTTIDEKTELTIPLKVLISSIFFIVVASFYVATTQNRIGDIEHSVRLLDQKVESYHNAPGRSTTYVELLKKDIEYLKKEINELKKGK